MNTLFRFWCYFLRDHFAPSLYQEFRRYAAEVGFRFLGLKRSRTLKCRCTRSSRAPPPRRRGAVHAVPHLVLSSGAQQRLAPAFLKPPEWGWRIAEHSLIQGLSQCLAEQISPVFLSLPYSSGQRCVLSYALVEHRQWPPAEHQAEGRA